MLRLLPFALAALVALSGCEALSEMIVLPDPADTAPRTSRTTELAVTFNGMEVLQDCETVIEGAGDFDIEVRSQASFASSASGEVYKGKPQISQGHRTGGFGRRVFTGPAVDGQTVAVTFRASEIDSAPIRGNFPDPRLNNARNTATHTYRGGRWDKLGARYITLGGGGCQVRLHYDLEQLS